MKAAELANQHVVTIAPRESTDRAIALMEEWQIRHLPVAESDKLVGILSDRDLLLAVAWMERKDRVADNSGASMGPSAVHEIMHTPVTALPADAEINTVVNTMLEKHIHAIPITDDDKIIGIITQTDLLKCYQEDVPIAPRSNWRFKKVTDRMQTDVLTIAPGQFVMHAIEIFRKHHVHHLPVVDHNGLVGMLTDRDIRMALGKMAVDPDFDGPLHERLRKNVTVEEMMTRSVESTKSSATLADVADRMVEYAIGSLPVCDNDKLIGIITETDLMKELAEALN